MTYRRDNQSADDAIDEAVHDMHAGMARGSRPSSHVWDTIALHAGIDALAAERDHPGGSHTGTESEHGQPSGTSTRTLQRPSSHVGWSTWLVAAMVVVLAGASMNSVVRDRQKTDHLPTISIALAPGTPAASSIVPAAAASPVGSPGWDPYIPVHGPEFACTVEPLTADEVFQIVLNPGNGWSQKEPGSTLTDTGLYEERDYLMFSEYQRKASESYVASVDAAIVDPITETANMFWNCLMTGSALQVWGMMEPRVVQQEILMQHPVLRDEASLRTHIEEWGPRKYSASIYHAFPDLGNIEPYRASMHVKESVGAVRIGYSENDPWKAIVLMASHPQSDGYVELHLLLTIAPDGTWWVSGAFYDW